MRDPVIWHLRNPDGENQSVTTRPKKEKGGNIFLIELT